MKLFILVAVAASLLPRSDAAHAQGVTRSRQVPGFRPYDVDLAVMSKAEKDSIRMVADIWKMYVESFTSSSVSEEKRRSMWMDGSEDYLLEFDDGAMLYSSFRENRIIDVRKLDHGIYELVCMTSSKLPGEDNEGWVESVYRVCAMAVASSGRGSQDNPFRLGNWLDAVVAGLAKETVGPIDYHCTPGCSVQPRNVAGTASFVSGLAQMYGIGLDETIRYVVSPSVDQCEQISGFLFNAYSNPMMTTLVPRSSGYGFFGRVFGSRTLVSNYFDDHHDLALLLFRKGFPGALPMIQEGAASYYGGLMTYSYSDLKASLRSFFDSGREIDLTDEDGFYDTCIPVSREGAPGPVVVPLEGALGALLVEYSLKEGGVPLVKELLRCRSYHEIFGKMGVAPDGIRDFIMRILG